MGNVKHKKGSFMKIKKRNLFLVSVLLFSNFFIVNLLADIVSVEVQVGELVDKLTILEIKNERIDNEAKLKNIRLELDILLKAYKQFPQSAKLDELKKELKKKNEALWEIEDDIRDTEFLGNQKGYFDQINNMAKLTKEKLVELQNFLKEFIALARSVYYANDARCKAKRDINELLGSRLVEEKSYKNYKA